jgi:hypothetical protein
VGVCFDNDTIVPAINGQQNNQISEDQLKHVTSIKALDLYEAESRFNIPNPDDMLMLPNSGESKEAFVHRFSSRFMQALSQLQTQLDSENTKILNADTRYYTAGGLDRIQDTSEAYYLDPLRCVIATAIRQSMDNYGNLKIEYDNRIFNHPLHSDQSKGVLYLHEMTYRWSLDNQNVGSDSVRELVSFIILKNISRLSLFKHLIDTSLALPIEAFRDGEILSTLQNTSHNYVGIGPAPLGSTGYLLFQNTIVAGDAQGVPLIDGINADTSIVHDWNLDILIP